MLTESSNDATSRLNEYFGPLRGPVKEKRVVAGRLRLRTALGGSAPRGDFAPVVGTVQ